MTPAESAAWVAAALAGVFGITGFIVGLLGLSRAKKAQEAADAANVISARANTLSEESNGIAREANEISRKTADRGDEQHDVTWDWRYGKGPREGMVSIQNLGKNLAREVTAQFMFDAATEANDVPEDVDGRHFIHLEIPGLRGLIEGERRERARIDYQRAHSDPLMSATFMFFPMKYRTRLRVKWRSESGAPYQYDSDWTDEHLPD